MDEGADLPGAEGEMLHRGSYMDPFLQWVPVRGQWEICKVLPCKALLGAPDGD